MHIRFLHLLLILISIFFASCEADINLQNISDEISLHPDLIVPIGTASVSLGQIITQNDSSGRFEIGNDAEINYLSFDSSEFRIPDLNLLENSKELTRNLYPSPNGVLFIPPNSTIPTITDDNTVYLGTNTNINGDRIDSIRVNSATISVIINETSDLGSIPPSNLKFTIRFPNGKIRMLDGSSGKLSFSPLGYGLINDIDISNFMMSTSGGDSGIPIEISVDAKSGNLPLSVSPVSMITCILKFTKLDYAIVYGNFNSSLTLSNTLQQSIDFDKDLPNGSLKFANPQVFISAISNLGTYLNFKINEIKAFVSTNQSVNPVYANFNGNISAIFDLNRKPDKPGDTIDIKLRTIDKNWGGTTQLFENEVNENLTPDKLQYNFSVAVDSTLNANSKMPGYITSDAKIKVNIKTIIPLNFTSGSYYIFEDSIPNVFTLLSTALNQLPYSKITSCALILNITNGLPVKTTFSFVLNDSVGNILPTTIGKNYIIEAGKVDANGLVQPGKETKQTLQVIFSNDQLATLRKARTLTYKVRVEGENINSNIHFTEYSKFDLKVGLFVQGDVNTTLGTKTQK
jgi:hypothetical protein